MTKVICQKGSCIYQDRQEHCIREEIELVLDDCENCLLGLMYCKNYRED
jgi:hypothetical protein